MKTLGLMIISLFIVVPGSVLAFYKPVRVLLPEAFGVNCDNNVCVDDSSRKNTAVTIYKSARESLVAKQGLNISDTKIVFCSTKKCQRTFGIGREAGYTFGTFGIVIGPRGWRKHYVAHELIHHWQAEHFGNLVLLTGEQWIVEGMAYTLSDDPRKKLHQPFESYREQFSKWYGENSHIPLVTSVGKFL